MRLLHTFAAFGLILAPYGLAITVAELTGNRYKSPYRGSSFTNLTGLVTSVGYYTMIRSLQPDDDESTSESIGVLGFFFGERSRAGDIVTFDGTVYYDSRSSILDLYTYPIIAPHNFRLVSRGNPVEPVEMGSLTSGIIGNKDMRPPTEQYNRLDGNVFGFPNNVARVSEVNPLLEPRKYGMDFFQSFSWELVTITNVTALGRPSRDRTFTGPHQWVYGNWPVTGSNARGGLTVTDRDANPEAVILFDPIDGTIAPYNTKLGDSLTDITGVIEYEFGVFYIRPLTAPRIKASRSPALPPPSAIKSNGRCDSLSVADYNLENFAPGDSRIPLIVNHIATYLGAPSIIFLEGVEDNSGPKDDGTVDANLTLSGLTQALKARSGIPYEFIDINPVNNADGLEYGSNIRSAYVFNPRELRLRDPNPGNATDINVVLPGPSLRFNPGRIDAPKVFEYCRKPLVAQWETVDGKGMFFTINIQWTSKSGATSLQSDWRPPWNGGIIQRNAQANVTGTFIDHILAQDKNAAIIAAGDFAEFSFVEPLKRFVPISKLQDLDVLSNIPGVERYTSTSGNDASGTQEQLTHMFVSPSVARFVKEKDYEHVHVNTWVAKDDAASDYDPSIARLNVCRR
ncbi:MAG: hypothetical protein Q9219_003951 [cf. Caloplaca sp. 3 TL-2023]